MVIDLDTNLYTHTCTCMYKGLHFKDIFGRNLSKDPPVLFCMFLDAAFWVLMSA